MKPGASRVYGLAPRLAPSLVTFGLAVVSVVPVPIPDYAAVAPNLVLMSIYHWTLYRPECLSYGAVFVTGLFLDLLTTAPGTTIGLTPLLFLVARWSVLSNRRSFVGRDFPFVWAGFALTAAGYEALLWAAGGLLGGTVLAGRSFVFQAVLTVAAFPVATWLFARLQRAVAAAG